MCRAEEKDSVAGSVCSGKQPDAQLCNGGQGLRASELWEMLPDRSVTAAGRGWMPGNTDRGLGRAPSPCIMDA